MAGPSVENEPTPRALPSPMASLDHTKSPVSPTARSLKSRRSTRPVRAQTQVTIHEPTLTPIQRFRKVAQKVVHLNKASRCFSGHGPGAEPGVDVRKDSAFVNYGHIKQNCQIEIVDYSGVRSSFGRMTNPEFVSFLGDPEACERERWAKVRWINVGGISWDVVRALALRYNLHPLSLEELLHTPGRPRSGASYYKEHLFIRILSHTLVNDEDEEPDFLEQIVRSSSPEPFEPEDKAGAPSDYLSKVARRTSSLIPRLSSKLGLPRKAESGNDDVELVDVPKVPSYADLGSGYATYNQGYKTNRRIRKLMKELKECGRVSVAIKPVCVFLLRDGTVISIHPDNNLKFTEPIRRRLNQTGTGLRSTADASLLVHALLDLVVDSALEIVDAYRRKIIHLERQALLNPTMSVIRQLHIISGDLILRKRTLGPIRTLVYAIRRYDADRVAALYNAGEQPDGWKAEGYMSKTARTYLADVYDNMEYILTSIEMFASVSQNLINYSFNMSSHGMNRVMKTLTTVTVLFTPLTILTGYFGMRFDIMWSVDGRSDILFGEIAIPMIMITTFLFFRTDFIRMGEWVMRKGI